MYIKIKKEASFWQELHDSIQSDDNNYRRVEEFIECNYGVTNWLMRHSAFFRHHFPLAFEFTVTPDNKWTPFKDTNKVIMPKFFVPNKRTKEGKAIFNELSDLQANFERNRFDRLKLYKYFGSEFLADGQKHTVANAWLVNDEIYMAFDEIDYERFLNKHTDKFVEVSHEEWTSITKK